MAYPISDVTRRVVYTGSAGTGPYSFSFEVLANTDIQVYKNTTLLTLTTNYTVTINSNGTGSVTLVSAATGSDTITIVGDRAIQRATDFVTGGDLFANTLNDEFDSLVIFTQQVDEKADRGLKAPVTDPTDVNMTLPVKATRKGTVLAFNETTGNPEAGPSIGSVTTVADQSANINTVANNISSVNTVAGNSANVTTVAGVSSSVSTVAGISSNVTTVAGISSNVTTVAGNNANVTAVGTISGNVTTVAGISANVTTVAGISSNVTTVAGVSAAVTTNATNISSINTNASNITAIQNASTNATNAAASAVAAGNAQTAAEAARDATLTAYDNFDDRYLGSKTSDPSLDNDGNALAAGSLYFNSSSGAMKVYTGSAWVAAYVSGSGYLASSNNLSDLANASTARTNLGLGTAAVMTGPSGTIVGTSDNQTLTNKTLTSPTLTSPALGTPASGIMTNVTGLPLTTGVTGILPVANGGLGINSTPSSGQIPIGNGTNYSAATLSAGAGIGITNASGSITVAATGSTINSQTTGYTLVAADAGKTISITTGGVTIPNSVMSAGNIISIYNNSGSSQTITQGTGVTLQWAGQTSSTTGSRTLGLYGMATIIYITASIAVITGSGLT